MSFTILTDSGSNLTAEQIERNQLHVIPVTYYIDGVPCARTDLTDFDGSDFYGKLRERRITVTTSLINTDCFISRMEPFLKAGQDVLYVGMSSGISGTYQAAFSAAASLQEQYPRQTVAAFDSRGASFGQGLLALKAARLRAEGLSLPQALEQLTNDREHLRQLFTVDDLIFL